MTLTEIGEVNVIKSLVEFTESEDDEKVHEVRRHRVPEYYRADGSPKWKRSKDKITTN